MNPFELLLATISFGALPGKAFAQKEAANEKEKALELYAKQQDLAYSQKQESNLDLMKRVLDRQKAQFSTRGLSYGSESYGAIERDTINQGAKAARNLQTEKDLADYNLRTEKENVHNAFYTQLFGDVVEAGSFGAQLAGK